MKMKDIMSLKYYLAFVLVVIGFYVYSARIGWNWIGNTSTEHEKPDKSNPAYQRRYLHK